VDLNLGLTNRRRIVSWRCSKTRRC